MPESRTSDLAIVTVVTRNYAHYAQVLMQRCGQLHPEADLFVVYADRPPEDWREETPRTQAVYADELGISQWHRFAFQYTPFELSCALKPHAIEHLQQQGYSKIVYLDGDMQLYARMDEVLESLEHNHIVLTPHRLKPLRGTGADSIESTYLVSGAYNAGFLAVSTSDVGREFIAWWKAMNRRQCIIDFANSLFVDQAWLSLVPGLFEGVHILRHPGYNAGHWSLDQFRIADRDGARADDRERGDGGLSPYEIGGCPLVLFHFSGMTPTKLQESSNHSLRKTISTMPALMRMIEDYHQSLQEAGRDRCEGWGCLYAKLNDGRPISPAWREAVRRLHPAVRSYANPFDAKRNPEMIDRFQGTESGAHQWRGDWRLKWAKSRGVGGRAKAFGLRLQGVLRHWVQRAKPA